MTKRHDETIGEGTTTLDYLKVRYGWLGLLIDEADAELKRLRAENTELKATVNSVDVGREVMTLRDLRAAVIDYFHMPSGEKKRAICAKYNLPTKRGAGT